MKDFIQEFKAFAIKGNVVDLAVAVVIGAAFGKIVSSLVENIITPSMGLLMGGIDFSGQAFSIDGAVIKYGVFIQSVIDFLIVSFVIFLAIKVLARMKKTEAEKVSVEKPKELSDEVKLLVEIRDSLQRQEQS